MMGPDYDKVAFDLKVVRSWHEWTGDMIKSSRETILMRHVRPSQRVDWCMLVSKAQDTSVCCFCLPLHFPHQASGLGENHMMPSAFFCRFPGIIQWKL